MTIDKAGDELDDVCRGLPWFVAAGVGANSTIYVYTKGKVPQFVKEVYAAGWHRFKVEFRKMGQPKPAGGEQ